MANNDSMFSLIFISLRENLIPICEYLKRSFVIWVNKISDKNITVIDLWPTISLYRFSCGHLRLSVKYFLWCRAIYWLLSVKTTEWAWCVFSKHIERIYVLSIRDTWVRIKRLKLWIIYQPGILDHCDLWPLLLTRFNFNPCMDK